MADVKWIKIVTNIFDDEKMLMIESLPSADSIMVVWFKLLCLAGKTNNSGIFIFNDRIPYTDEMLASIFRRDVSVIRLALKTFENFGMIEIINNVITIPNWSKHQTLDAYERQKERDRLKKQKARAEKKALISGKSADKSGDASVDKSGDVPTTEEDIEEERDTEIIEEITAAEPPAPPRSNVPYESIKNIYNEICTAFPKCTAMSDVRKKAIKARFAGGYTIEHFRTVFEKAQASSFLRGANDRNWMATFDWLIKDSNMAKVLGGNYDDRTPQFAANRSAPTSGVDRLLEMMGRGDFDE